MILIVEVDVTKRYGRWFTWRPIFFRGPWMRGTCWRIAWGIWGLSFYPSSGLKEHTDHIESGATQWYDATPPKPWV